MIIDPNKEILIQVDQQSQTEANLFHLDDAAKNDDNIENYTNENEKSANNKISPNDEYSNKDLVDEVLTDIIANVITTNDNVNGMKKDDLNNEDASSDKENTEQVTLKIFFEIYSKLYLFSLYLSFCISLYQYVLFSHEKLMYRIKGLKNNLLHITIKSTYQFCYPGSSASRGYQNWL